MTDAATIDTPDQIVPDTGALDTLKGFFATKPAKSLLDEIGVEGKARLSDEDRRARIRRSFGFNLRSALDLRDVWAGETACIVGGGPSLSETFPELLEFAAAGAAIIAVNKTHDWLIERGLVPTFGIMCDPKDWVATYQTPTSGVKYLLGSQLHDDVFARFKDVDEVYLWHAMGQEEDREAIRAAAEAAGQRAFAVEGGSTTSLRAFDMAALLLGFREVRFFALDSSATTKDGLPADLHPYAKPHVDPVNIPFKLLDPKDGAEFPKLYWTNRPMFHQLRQFEIVLDRTRRGIQAGHYPKVRIAVHGTGVLPDWAALRGLHADPNRAAMLRAYQPSPEEIALCQDQTA